MPASRWCRACGAVLSPHVRWCGLCHEPVREFTPRDRVHRGDFVGDLRHDRLSSRWVSSATTFGAAGRLGATLLLLLPTVAVPVFLVTQGYWPIALIFLLVGGIVGGFSVRSIWAPVRLPDRERGQEPGPSEPPGRIATKSPGLDRLNRPIPAPSRAALSIAGLAGIGLLVLFWQRAGGSDRFLVVAGLLALGAGAALSAFIGS